MESFWSHIEEVGSYRNICIEYNPYYVMDDTGLYNPYTTYGINYTSTVHGDSDRNDNSALK